MKRPLPLPPYICDDDRRNRNIVSYRKTDYLNITARFANKPDSPETGMFNLFCLSQHKLSQQKIIETKPTATLFAPVFIFTFAEIGFKPPRRLYRTVYPDLIHRESKTEFVSCSSR